MFENTFQKVTDAVKPLVLAAATFGAYNANTEKADAAILTNINQYNNSKAFANDLAQNVDALPAAVKRINNTTNIVTYSSAIVIAPDLVLTAAHVNSPNVTLSEIILGSNYYTSTERHAVLSSQNHPNYNSAITGSIDLSVVRLSSLVTNFNTPVIFAPFSDGQTLAVAEYGNFGDTNTGEQTSIGDLLGGRAKALNTGGGSYPDGTYFLTQFEGPGASDALNVGLLNRASGSGWYDEPRNLVAMSVAATNDSFGGGYSILLNLSDPSVQSWIQPQIQASWDRYNAVVPEPSAMLALATFGAGAAYYAACRRRS